MIQQFQDLFDLGLTGGASLEGDAYMTLIRSEPVDPFGGLILVNVTQWDIVPLPPGILGQYQPLALGLVSWVQAWVSQAGGEQTTQIEATSNLITFTDSLNIKTSYMAAYMDTGHKYHSY